MAIEFVSHTGLQVCCQKRRIQYVYDLCYARSRLWIFLMFQSSFLFRVDPAVMRHYNFRVLKFNLYSRIRVSIEMSDKGRWDGCSAFVVMCWALCGAPWIPSDLVTRRPRWTIEYIIEIALSKWLSHLCIPLFLLLVMIIDLIHKQWHKQQF